MSNINNEDNGLINIICSHTVKDTIDRLESILSDKGMNIVARINHAAGAEKIGEQLRPTELIIFGNPKAGTPLMQKRQSVAIDLPQKILVWEDDNGKVWLSYNNPNYLEKRHDIIDCDELINKIGNSLDIICKEASQ